MAEKVEVRTRYYEFVMDPNVPFKQGRYEGSSLGNFADVGWYWKLGGDEDITAYFGHLALSNIDLSPLLDAIDDETFKIIKRDVMRGDIPLFARIFYGWRDLEYLSTTIYGEIDNTLEDLVSRRKLSEDDAEIISDRVTIDYEKLAEECGELASHDIVGLIRKAKDLKDMLKIMRSEIMEGIIWETCYEVASGYIADAIKKARK